MGNGGWGLWIHDEGWRYRMEDRERRVKDAGWRMEDVGGRMHDVR